MIALLCDFTSNTAGTILDHVFGIRDLSSHDVTVVNFRGELPKSVDLDRFDGLIIHYSLVACHDSYISPLTRIRIRNFEGIKIAFVQDDYRFIDDTVEAMAAMRINALLGLAGRDIIDDVYSPEKLPDVRRETVLTGYVPEHLLKMAVPKYETRPIDVSCRVRKLPAWLGSHGQEKWIIADKFIKSADKYGLKYDISWKESDRIYGDKWLEFISNSKATIGAESGSGVCDFTGKIQENVDAHVARDPDVTFEKLRDLYFREEDGRLMMNVISPRCFEAAAMRTLMIMYEGHYSGRLVAGRHYVVLDRDHGNMDEVVAILRDPKKAQEIIDNAYNEVARNPENTFGAMVKFLDEVIAERYGRGKGKGKGKSKMMGKGSVALAFTIYFIRMRNVATSKLLRVVELSAPPLVRLLDWILKYFPRPIGRKIRSRLQRLCRRIIRRETSFIRPAFPISLMLLFSSRFRRDMFQAFGKDMVRKSPVRVFWVATAIRHIVDMVAAVTLADGVKVAMAHDPAREVLVLRAHNLDSPLEWEALRPKGLDELAQEVEQGAITPKAMVWSPIGLHGLSKSLPFTGTKEFGDLTWGLEACPVQVVRFLQSQLVEFVD